MVFDSCPSYQLRQRPAMIYASTRLTLDSQLKSGLCNGFEKLWLVNYIMAKDPSQTKVLLTAS